MKMRAIKTFRGCPDGFTPREFKKGQEFEAIATFANTLLAGKLAEEVAEKKPAKKAENKMKNPAYGKEETA